MFEDTSIKLPTASLPTIFADKLDRPRHMAVRDNGDVFVALRSGQHRSRRRAAPAESRCCATRTATARRHHGTLRPQRRRHRRRDSRRLRLLLLGHGRLRRRSSTTTSEPRANPSSWSAASANRAAGTQRNPSSSTTKATCICKPGSPRTRARSRTERRARPARPCPLLERFGGIWRYVATARNQDQSRRQPLLDGPSQRGGAEWNPVVNKLYFVMHGRDQLDTLFPEHYTAAQRSELPAEEFQVVEQGDNFGWPYTYYDQIRGQRMVVARIRRRRQYAGRARQIQRSPDRLSRPLGPRRPALLYRQRNSPSVIAMARSSLSTARGIATRRTATAWSSCRWAPTANRREVRNLRRRLRGT